MSHDVFDDDSTAVEGDQVFSAGSGVEDFYASLQREREEQFKAYRAYAGSELYVKHLRSAHASFSQVDEIKVGDLVQWKTFLRNGEYPDYGAPAIVMGFREELVSEDASSIDRQDVILGVLDHDQDLRLVVTDRRRLMAWVAGEA